MTMEELLEIEEIRKLRVLYSHYYDGADLDALCDLFTDDAVCEFGPNFGGDWVGKAMIKEKYNGFIAGEGLPHDVMHAVTNHNVVLVSDTEARGRAYLLDLRTQEGAENPLILFGIYDDIYKKVDGQWKIHRTRIDFLWPQRDVGENRVAALAKAAE